MPPINAYVCLVPLVCSTVLILHDIIYLVNEFILIFRNNFVSRIFRLLTQVSLWLFYLDQDYLVCLPLGLIQNILMD